MNRRSAIKNLSLAGGSLITLPAWMVSCGISDTNVHESGFTPKQQEILAAVANTIIPAGNSIGAISVETDKYLQKLIDDCFEDAVKQNVKKQLLALDAASKKTYRSHFADCSQKEREQMLKKLEDSTDKNEKEFFTLMKTETIRGFTTSQKVMEEYLGYKIAPGHYYGCVPV